jgi:hypothetical protein
MGAPWSAWGKNVLKRAETQASMKAALGRRYVPVKGRAGGNFFATLRLQASRSITKALQPPDCPSTLGKTKQYFAFDLIQGQLIATAVVKLSGPGRCMVGHCSCLPSVPPFFR